MGDFGYYMPAIGSVIGSYWGYAGMMIGQAIGGMFVPEAEDHTYYNDLHKDTKVITKPDPLPVLFGTDICPGNVIWLDPYMVMREHTAYGNEALNNWADGFMIDFMMFHIHFIACFGDALKQQGNVDNDYYINRVWFDKRHHWLYMRFNDFIHYKHNYLAGGYNDFSIIWLNCPWYDLHQYYDPEGNWTPINNIGWIRWWGAMDSPLPQPLVASMFWSLEEIGFEDFAVATPPPKVFPALEAECSSNTVYTPFAGAGGVISSYNHTYRDNNSHYLYGILNIGILVMIHLWQNKYILFKRYNIYNGETTTLLRLSGLL